MTTQKVAQKKSDNSSIVHRISPTDLGVKLEDSSRNPVAFSTWVRVLRQNWRQGTVATKGRSDVARTGKKPWKQKGTGRARAGTPRSPLWRGGGVIFGPQARSKKLSLPRKVKQKVMRAILFDLLRSDAIKSLDWQLTSDVPKTASAFEALKKAGLARQPIVLFLPAEDVLSQASFANIEGVKIFFFDQANAFDMASKNWIVLKKDLDRFKEMVAQWI